MKASKWWPFKNYDLKLDFLKKLPLAIYFVKQIFEGAILNWPPRRLEKEDLTKFYRSVIMNTEKSISKQILINKKGGGDPFPLLDRSGSKCLTENKTIIFDNYFP